MSFTKLFHRHGRPVSAIRILSMVMMLGVTAFASPLRAQQYSVIEIPPAAGQTAPPLGTAINAIGEVTGEFDPAFQSIQPYAPLTPTLFVYAFGNGSNTGDDANGYPNGATTDLGPSNAVCSSHSSAFGYGINPRGQIVGSLCATTETPTAFVYQTGQFTGIGEAGEYASTASAINVNGSVTGTIEFPGVDLPPGCSPNDYHAFIYDSSTTAFQDLGLLPCSSHGVAINDAGQVAGYFADTSNNLHAFVYSNGTVTDLGHINIPNSPPYCTYSAEANGINAGRQVTGYSQGDCQGPEAFLYSDGAMQGIGTLGGPGGSVGNAINSSGQITGQSWTTGNVAQHAFVYSDAVMLDLNSQIPSSPAGQYTLVDGVAINDSGQIVVTGYINSAPDQTVTFLLTPSSPAALSATLSSISLDSDGNYIANIVITNTGNAPAPGAALAAAGLVVSESGRAVTSPTSTLLPVVQNGLVPGASVTVALTFPPSAGTPGAAAALRWSMTYSTGSASGTLRLALP